MIAQVILNGFVLGATIALMAVGLTLIFGILRIVNFWHGEAYMLGAVILFFFSVSMGLPYIWASIIAIVAVGALGWASDKLVFRRFHGNLMGGVIAAVALSMGIQNVTLLIFGPRPQAIPSVVTGMLQVFNTRVSAERLSVTLASFVVILVLAWFIRYTKLGKSMRAVQQDSEAAVTQGISVNHICALTFGIATALAALAGILIAPLYQITPSMGVGPLMLAFIVIILGGMGSVMGAFIASFIIGFQQSFTATFWGAEFATGVSFGLALLILFFLPRGLMGHE